MDNLLVSVAIICKNEEENIARCLDSVFTNIDQGISKEVLLIDSYSTDKTIEIAKTYPIKIIQLREDWPHSPAAGRYTGFEHVKGKYTLCLDADMTLSDGYLNQAIPYLEANENVAGVTGIIRHVKLNTPDAEVLNIHRRELQVANNESWDPDLINALKTIPGAGLFRTDSVLAVGNFQPFLRAEEEFELCQRLRRKGFELYYLPYFIADHYGYMGDEYREMMRRYRSKLTQGIGDMFKWSLTQGFVKGNLTRFRQHLILGLYFLLFPLAVGSVIISNIFLPCWIMGFVLLTSMYILKKKSAIIGTVQLVNKTIIGIQIYMGLFRQIDRPETYPKDVNIFDYSNSE